VKNDIPGYLRFRSFLPSIFSWKDSVMIDFIPEKEYQSLHAGYGPASPASAVSRHPAGNNGQVINVGREHVCVLSFEDGLSTSHDSFLRLGEVAAGSGIAMPESGQGVVRLRAAQDGLLLVSEQALGLIHGIDAVICQTLPNNEVVLKSQVVAKLQRVSPRIGEEKLQQVEDICHQHRPIIDVVPFKQFRVGIVTVGRNAPPGNWKDDMITPLLSEKFKEFGSSILRLEYVAADIDTTLAAIHKSIRYGADMIALVHSLEPEPYTTLLNALQTQSGTQDPRVYPGKFFSCSWLGPIPVLRFDATCEGKLVESLIDQVIPRFLAGIEITREDVEALRGDDFHPPGRS
jgi:hypothetical protein